MITDPTPVAARGNALLHVPDSRTQGLVLLAAAFTTVLSLVIGRAFTAVHPGDGDARLFAYVGSQWVDGVIPYRDIWDNKPPGIFSVFAAARLLSENPFHAAALFEAASVAVCNVAIFLLMSRFGAGRGAAALAMAASAIVCNLLFYNERGGLTEIYIVGAAAPAMLLFVEALSRKRTTIAFLSGVMTGLATVFKLPGLAPWLAQSAFLLLLVLTRRIAWSQLVRLQAALVIGIVAAWVPFVTYFAAQGSLAEMLDASFLYNVHYGANSQGGLALAVTATLDQLRPVAILVVGGIVTVIFVLADIRVLKPRRTATGNDALSWSTWLPLVALWSMFDLAGATAGGRNYPHYFLAMMPALSVMLGLAYEMIAAKIGFASRPSLGRIALGTILIGPLLLLQVDDLRSLRHVFTEPKVHAYRAGVDFLNEDRTPSSTMFGWDYVPYLFQETGMRSPSAWLSAHYIHDSPTAMSTIWDRIRSDLESHPPDYLAHITRDTAGRKAEDETYRWFSEFVRKRYDLAFVDSRLKIYRLRSASQKATFTSD
jgi:hypothetical protein